MKKIFWTSIFFLILAVLFLVYLRFFNTNLAKTIAYGMIKKPLSQENVMDTENNLKNTFILINTLHKHLDDISQFISKKNFSNPDSNQMGPILGEMNIKLYYFNEKENELLPPAKRGTSEALAPVFRTIPATYYKWAIENTIQLLLQGALTQQEVKEGFTSSFVKGIRLESMNLDENGVLALTFSKMPGTNIAGSAFVSLLTEAITKTAQQFPQVKKVLLLPEELFQP